MSFDQALRLTSVLLASASFIGLALGASLPEWLVLVTGSSLILVLLRALHVHAIDRLTGVMTLSTTGWNIILIISFAGFWADMFWISGELLPAGVHFLLILMVIKLFNLSLRRDYLHLYAISLMAILATAALTTDLWYLPIFLAYLLTGVWTLLLFQLTIKSDDSASPSGGSPVSGMPQPRNLVTPQLFWLANGLALGALCLTLLIFFAIPRVSAGLFQKGYGDSIRTSGFSDTVDLGSIGPIKRDPSIVMRVELPDRGVHETSRLYLRGVAYDRYDGKAWTNRLTHRRALPEIAPMTFAVRQSQARPTRLGTALRQNILLESLDTAVLFVAPFAESVSGRFLTVQTDAVGALSLPFPSSARFEYSVVSRENAVLPADLEPQSVSYSEPFARHFLQTPAQPDRIASLAQTITKDARSQYEKAVAVEKYLEKHYRYSLDIPPTQHASPIEDFLFTRKTGYCEHYATAMVVLLRAVGVPARLVTGFLATEWNEYGNYYLVRQQDAHAWVEVHLPQSGWIMLDPTPAISEGAPPPGWHAFGRMMDSVRLRWNRFFVQYSVTDQLAVVRELKEGTESIRTHAWRSLSSLLSPLATKVGDLLGHVMDGNLGQAWKFLGLVLLGTGILSWLLWKRPWSRIFGLNTATKTEQPITRLYIAMLHYLEGKGMAKSAGTAPVEFRCMIRKEWSAAGDSVATITDVYCKGRFGPEPLTDEDFLLAQQAFRNLMRLERT